MVILNLEFAEILIFYANFQIGNSLSWKQSELKSFWVGVTAWRYFELEIFWSFYFGQLNLFNQIFVDDSHVIRNRKGYHSIHFSGILRFTVVNRGQTVVKLSSLRNHCWYEALKSFLKPWWVINMTHPRIVYQWSKYLISWVI